MTATDPTVSAPISPVTGKPMRRDVRPMVIAHAGRSATVEMPGWYCADSDESVHSGADMKVSDRALNRLRADAIGVLDADAIRRIRRTLGLSQREAGALIGGGPRAFQKYESGEILASRAVSNLLRVLERDPFAVDLLRQVSEPPPPVPIAAE